jgi:phosphoglucomutase
MADARRGQRTLVSSSDDDKVVQGLGWGFEVPDTGEDPGEHYLELTEEFGAPFYTRIDGRQRPSRRRGCRSYHPIMADQEDFRLVAKAS